MTEESEKLSKMRTILLALALRRDIRYDFTDEEIDAIECILTELGVRK